MNRIDKIIWFLLPVAFYFAAFLGEWYTVALLAPFFIYGGINALLHGIKITKTNLFIYLYVISIIITSLIKGYYGALYSLVALILFINAHQNRITSIKELSDCLKYFIIGALSIGIYHFFIFLNFGGDLSVMGFRNLDYNSMLMIQNYTQTSQDGPILFSISLCFIIVGFNLNQNKLSQFGFRKIINFTIILSIFLSIFYILLIYNRRLLILAVLIIIALYYSGLYRQIWLYKYSVFLPYLGFLILGILLVSFDLNKIFFLEGLLNRTDDLQEDNTRLIAWSIALNEYKNLGLKDMFMYSKEIVFFYGTSHSHSHNGVLQIVYERGLFGLFTFILLCYMIFKEIGKIKMPSASLHTILLIILVIFINSITESPFRTNNIDNIIFILIVSLLTVYNSLPYKTNKKNN